MSDMKIPDDKILDWITRLGRIQTDAQGLEMIEALKKEMNTEYVKHILREANGGRQPVIPVHVYTRDEAFQEDFQCIAYVNDLPNPGDVIEHKDWPPLPSDPDPVIKREFSVEEVRTVIIAKEI